MALDTFMTEFPPIIAWLNASTNFCGGKHFRLFYTGVFISTRSRSPCRDREPDDGTETLHGAEGNACWYEIKKSHDYHMTFT